MLAVGEFRVLFVADALAVIGLTMQQLALSALVFGRTGSALLAALAYLGGFLPQAVGALTLLSWADRVPPRGFLALWGTVRAGVALVLALAGLPVLFMLGIVMAVGLGDAVAGAVRAAVLADILPREGFILGRSLLNVSVGAMQIVGYAIGGTLLAVTGPERALLLAASVAAATAVLTQTGLRPRAARATGYTSLSTTHQGNRQLLGDPLTRALLLASWVPNGLIVGAEAMFVPYAGEAAGVLFVAAAGGMLLGDVAVGRWLSPRARSRLIVPLLALLAVPYLFFAFLPSLWVAAVAVVVASVGFAASLVLQERLLSVVPAQLRGQAFGLASSGMMTAQAVAALLAGSLADMTSPALAIAVVALASLTVTALLAGRLRRVAEG